MAKNFFEELLNGLDSFGTLLDRMEELEPKPRARDNSPRAPHSNEKPDSVESDRVTRSRAQNFLCVLARKCNRRVHGLFCRSQQDLSKWLADLKSQRELRGSLQEYPNQKWGLSSSGLFLKHR